LIAVKKGDRLHTVGKHRFSVDFNRDGIETELEPMPLIADGTVMVRLTNADTGEFLFEREFRITLKPLEMAEL